MPSRETLITFREGLKAIQTVDDYATLKDTIIRMMAFTTPDDAHFARDAIARTIRKKQAVELQRFQGYPQQIANLDQKYRDLAIVLAKAKTAPPKPVAVTPKLKPAPAPTPEKKPERDNKKQMVKASAFNGLNAPLMVMNWIKSRKKTLVLGTALASSIGGLYWMYKFLTKNEDEKSKKNPEEKETGFDKTIRSIQRYRAFTQASKDPDFMGDYEALVSGKEIPVRKKVKKKPELDKTTEWEQEERSLMKNMDSAFNAIGTKPKVNVSLPQLPAPRDIDPSSVIELTRGKKEEASVVEKPKKKKRRKPKPKPKPTEATTLSVGPSMPTPPPSKPKPKTKKKNPQPKEAAPKSKPKPKKASKPKKAAEKPAGRLIPIVKRTKRVKKVRA